MLEVTGKSTAQNLSKTGACREILDPSTVLSVDKTAVAHY